MSENDPELPISMAPLHFKRDNSEFPAILTMTTREKMCFPFDGIDEWGACEVMGQQFRSEEYDLVVFDTAPTGHTLKALASPSHVKQFILQLRRLKSKLLGKLLLFKSKKADELELCLAEFCDEIDLTSRLSKSFSNICFY